MIDYLVELKKSGPLHQWEVPYFIKKFHTELFGLTDVCYIPNPNYNALDKNSSRFITKNFSDANAPLKMVSMNNREFPMVTEKYLKYFREYRMYNVYAVTGMSFSEWMQLPPHLLEAFIEDIRAEEVLAKSLSNTNGALGELGAINKTLSGLGRKSKAIP